MFLPSKKYFIFYSDECNYVADIKTFIQIRNTSASSK